MPLFKTFCTNKSLVKRSVSKVYKQLRSQLPEYQKTYWRKIKLVSSLAVGVLFAGIGAGLIATGFFAPLGVGLFGYGVVIGVTTLTGLTIGLTVSHLASIGYRKKKMAAPIQPTVPHQIGKSQAYIHSHLTRHSPRSSRADLDEELSRSLLSAERAATEARAAQHHRIAADALVHNILVPVPTAEVGEQRLIQDQFK